MNDVNSHSPLDSLLGATPRRVARHWLSILILALAAVGAVIFFVRFVAGDDSPYLYAPIERGDMIPLISEQGVVHGSGEDVLRAAIDGRIAWVAAPSDGGIEQDALMARIDAGALETMAEADEQDLDAIEARIAGLEVTARESASRLARFETVWRRSEGRAPSLGEMEQARAAAREADRALEAARHEARAAKLRVSASRKRKAGTEVRAPHEGHVVVRHVEAGDLVGQGQALFTLARGIRPLSVEVHLPDREDTPLSAGTLARVRLDKRPGETFAAKLTRIKVTPAPSTTAPIGVFTIEEGENAGQEQPAPVQPGMRGTVEIELPRRENVLLVPNAALSFEPDGQRARKRERIYLLTEDGEPRRVYVTVGGSDGQRTEVFGNGLRPGDQVIIGWRAPGA